MSALKSYCYSLIIVSIIATLIILLAPTNSRVIKYLRWISALCVTTVLISPVLNLSKKTEFILSESEEIIYRQENPNDLILKEFKSKLSDSVKELVSDKFNVDCNSVNIEIISEDIEAISLEKIGLSINTNSVFL